MSYYFSKTLNVSFEEAVARVTEELKKEGFGILTDIDVQATLKKKLNADFRKYRILGACNPPLAHRALEADPSVGALLPCNVVLREDGTDTIVEAMDPMAVIAIADAPGIRSVAEEARARLERAIASLGTPA